MQSQFLRGFALAAILAVSASAQIRLDGTLDQPWTPVQQINTTGLNSGNTNEGSAAYTCNQWAIVCWPEQAGTAQVGAMDPFASVSFDGGVNWLTPARVNTSTAANSSACVQPQCVVTENPQNPGTPVFVCIWEEAQLHATTTGTGARDDVFWAWSFDGVNWIEMGCLSNGCGSANKEIDEAQIACSKNGVIAVVWEEDAVNDGVNGQTCSGGNEAVYMRVSTDGGVSFGPIQRLNNVVNTSCFVNDIDSPNVQVSDDGQTIVAAWHDDYWGSGNDLWVWMSTDQGATNTLTSVENPIGADPGHTSNTPSIECEGQQAAVAYEDDGGAGTSVHYVQTFDGGQNWLPEIDVTPQTTLVSGAGVHYLDMTCDFQNLQVFICCTSDYEAASLNLTPNNGGSSGSRQLYVSYSLDMGYTFTGEINLDPGRADQECFIGGRDGRYAIFFETNPFGSNDAAYAWTTDAGTTWSMAIDASTSTADVDGQGQNEGRLFHFEDEHLYGITALRWNPTGSNEYYTSRFSLPFVGLRPIAAGSNTVNFAVKGALPTSTSIVSAFVAISSAPRPSPISLFVGSEPVDLIIDPGLTFATMPGGSLSVFTDCSINLDPDGTAYASATLPAFGPNTFGFTAVGAVIYANGQILTTDAVTL